MRRLIGFALLPFVLLATIPKDAPDRKIADKTDLVEIVGYYHVAGKMGTKNYAGIAKVAKLKETYIVQWLVDAAPYLGVGLRRGDIFAVGWTVGEGEKIMRGINLYSIKEKGQRLEGKWLSLPGSGFPSEENWTFLKELDEE
jgi:hypothetical protein